MKQTKQTPSRHRVSRILSVFTLLLILFSVSQTTFSQVSTFRGVSISPFAVPANTATTIKLEAEHYGRPIVNIPCEYDFYVLALDEETVVTHPGYPFKTRITLPSNAGRLNMDLPVNLPVGHYMIQYEYINTFGAEGPYSFLDFWVGEVPNEQTASISLFGIKESWLSLSNRGYRYANAYGQIDQEAETIAITLDHYHKNLEQAEAVVSLKMPNSSLKVGKETYGHYELFTIDLTKPASITVISEDKSVEKTYTVTVTNGTDGDQAWVLPDIEFTYWNTEDYEYQSTIALREENSDEYVLNLPTQLSKIDKEKVSCMIYSGFGSVVTIDDEEVMQVSTEWGYRGNFNFTEFNKETYTLTATSADGTVTNEYTIRVNEQPIPPVWFNEEYCTGIYYQNEYDEIEEAIPLAWLDYISIHLNESFLEGKTIRHGHVRLRQVEGNQEYPVCNYPEELPRAPEKQIWFPQISDMGIEVGNYEVILNLELEEDTEWPMMQDYVLGGFTLVEETVYPISRADLSDGHIGMNKTVYREGDEVEIWVWGSNGYKPEAITIYKTGEEATTIPFEEKSYSQNGVNCTFTMPAFGITITSTFKQISSAEDIAAVEAAQEIIADANITFTQAEAPTRDVLKAALPALINGLISESTGITVTTDDISIDNFQSATNENNGHFTFTVAITKGDAYVNLNTTGTIFATPLYVVTVGTSTGGNVTATHTLATEGETIELSLSFDEGYEFKSISAYKTSDNSVAVALTGTGNTRSFTMPAYGVTVRASFGKTQEQEDKEVLEMAQEAIEGGTFQPTQTVVGYSKENLIAWLINRLQGLLGERFSIQLLRSDNDRFTAEMQVTDFSPAQAGTFINPEGTNGTFTFQVALKQGTSLLRTLEKSGVIRATPYTETPPDPNPEPITYEVTVSAGEGGTISPSDTITVYEGDSRTFTFTPDEGYEVADVLINGESKPEAIAAGEYTFENITKDSRIEVVFRPKTSTGITREQATPLTAYVQDNTLHAYGLTPGQPWKVYTLSGILIRQGIAGSNEAKTDLPARGTYIIQSGKETIKVAY